MQKFTRLGAGVSLGRVEQWFTLRDVISWYAMGLIDELGTQEEAKKAFKVSRQMLGYCIKGERKFQLDHLERLADWLASRERPPANARAELLYKLSDIAREMAHGKITKAAFDQRVEESQKKGRKVTPERSGWNKPRDPAIPSVQADTDRFPKKK